RGAVDPQQPLAAEGRGHPRDVDPNRRKSRSRVFCGGDVQGERSEADAVRGEGPDGETGGPGERAGGWPDRPHRFGSESEGIRELSSRGADAHPISMMISKQANWIER